MGFLIADSRLLCLNVKKLEQNSKEGIYYINRLFFPPISIYVCNT